jgi:hypothetical protein
MITDTSLKRRFNWNLWVPPILFVIFLIIENQAFDTYYTMWVYGLLLIITGIFYSFRYKIYQPGMLFCLAGVTLWHYALAAHFDTCLIMLRQLGFDISLIPANNPFSMMIWLINLVVFLILMIFTGPVILKAFRLEQAAMGIFRAAAQTVTTTGNGFTSRPFFAGNAEYSKEQITGFTQYLAGQMIVYPVYSEAGVFMTFSMGKSPLAIKDSSEISYITYENTGKITVHIASADYRRFRKQLTFDRLCDSLGEVFKRFLNYYINNQESKILLELKST